jgi:hypothetical protein
MLDLEVAPRVVLLDKGLILNLEILDPLLPHGQFHGHLVPLVLGGLQLCDKDIPVDLDLLLPLLHAHLELVLLVLEGSHVLVCAHQPAPDLLYLELHDVVLDQHLLLLLGHLAQVLVGHVVLEGELLDRARQHLFLAAVSLQLGLD